MKRMITILFAIVLGLNGWAKEYKGGEIQSKKEYLYGRFEARMYCAINSGVLSTFFLYKPFSYEPGVQWEEIDFEIFGKDWAYSWQSNIIYEDENGVKHNTEEKHWSSFSLGEGYHNFRIDWTPDYIKWYIDDQLIREFYDQNVLQHFDSPQKVCFNLWSAVDENWVGPFDVASLPAYQFVDWFAYTGYDVGNGSFQESNTRVFQFWKNSISKFWEVSTHTFDENRCDFDANNVGSAKGGRLCLALTNSSETGISKFAPIELAGSGDEVYNKYTKYDRIYQMLRWKRRARVVEVPNTNNGTQIQIGTFDNQAFLPSQEWYFKYVGNNYYLIINRESGKAIDLPGGGTWDGNIFQQYDAWEGNENQFFKIIWIEGTNYYRIMPKKAADDYSYKSFHVEDAEGAKVQLMPFTGTDNQLFLLRRTDAVENTSLKSTNKTTSKTELKDVSEEELKNRDLKVTAISRNELKIVSNFNEDSNSEVGIFDLSGRLIQRSQLKENENRVLLKQPLNNGLYLIRVGNANQTITKKILIY